MKGCIIAGVILLLIIIAVGVNAVYVRSATEELLMLVDKLPSVPDPQNTASAIFEIHQKLKLFTPLLGITVSYNTIDRVSEALIILEANVRTGDSMQYAATLSLLRDLIEELSRLEKISVENILWLTPPVLGVSHFV